MLSSTQITAIIERLLYIFIPMLTTYGLTTAEDEKPIILALSAVIAAGVGYWKNRPSRLIARAAKVPGTEIVTSAGIADKLPAANVTSSAHTEVTRR